MPIIRLTGAGGGFFDSAGQAAGAFDQATAQGRQQSFVRERSALQLLGSQQELAARAKQQDVANAATTRSLDLRERAIEAQDIRRRSSAAVELTDGLPISGQSVIQMLTRLSALDRPSYERLAPVIRSQLQGRFSDPNDVTAEALDQLENLPDLYGTIAQPYAQAIKAADINAVRNGFEQTIGAFVDDPALLKDDKEWAQWAKGLGVAFARAQRAPGGATTELMAPLYEAAREEGARIASVKQQRVEFLERFTAAAKNADPKRLQSAKIRLAEIGSSQNPKQVFVEAMVRLDPEFELAHELGRKVGYQSGSVEAATAQVKAQKVDAVNVDTGKAGDRTEEIRQFLLDTAPDSITSDSRPGLYRALGLTGSDRDAGSIADSMDALEFDTDNPEAFDSAIRRFLVRESMMDEKAALRYGGRIK